MREEQGVRIARAQDSLVELLGANRLDDRLTYLLDNVPEMVFIKDREGYYSYMNAAALACLGHGKDYIKGRRVSIFDLMPRETALRIYQMDEDIMASGEGLYNVEQSVVGLDGAKRWYSGTRIPLRDGTGVVVGLAGIAREITAARRQEALFKSHASLLEMIVRGEPLPTILSAVVLTMERLLDNVSGSILLLDEGSRLRHGAAPSLPEAYVALVDGVAIGPRVGSCGTAAWRRESVYVNDTFHDPLWSDFVEIVMRHGLRSCWSTPITGNGDVLLGTFALYSGTVRMPSDVEKEIIDMATNIAGIAIDRRRAEDRVNFMAHHDPLTGLSNRNLFWSQFRRVLHEAKSEGRVVAITYLDLDDFKQINDLYGHATGDEVLRCLAERISSCINASDIAVRLGGDEFAIILSSPAREEEAIRARLDAIRAIAGEPIAIETGSISVTCSSGTAFYPADGDTPEHLLAKADAAMYSAKRSGRNNARIFDDFSEMSAGI